MLKAPDGIIAPELRRLRKLLARKRHEPIRIIITTDPTRPVRTLTIPRLLPGALLLASGILLLTAIALSFSTYSMRGRIAGLKNRVVAMMQLSDSVAIPPEGVAQAGVFGPSGIPAAHLRLPSGAHGRFTIEAANTGEQLEVVIDLASGQMDETSYRALRHLMRCRRTGAEVPIDPRLIELLYQFAQRTGEKIVLISGYRAPAYAAPASYHVRGMAADIRIPGMTALMVRDLARAMGVHGIGYYPRSQFVHVDMREEPFFWTDLGVGESSGGQEFEGSKTEANEQAGIVADP
jgi:uncharacterized protein YcbK (DUF882 family)